MRNRKVGDDVSKRTRHNDNKRRTATKGKLSVLWRVGIAILGIGLVVGFLFWSPATEPWGLPAIPANPRPATLSPALFSGEAAKAYQIAQEVPELLERMPCYCGCYVSPGHRNNLDCYTDRHGAG